jgi:hypothetical protein
MDASSQRLFVYNYYSMAFSPSIFLLLLSCYLLFRVSSLELDSPNHTGLSTLRNNPKRSCMASEATSLLDTAILHTPLQNVTCHSRFSLVFRTSDENRWLNFTLELSPDIISNSAQVTYVKADGTSYVCQNHEYV